MPDQLAAFTEIMDQVYEATTKASAVDGTKPLCACNLDNSLFRNRLGSTFHRFHVDRLKKIKGLKIRSIAAELDKGHVPDATYISYRYIKELKTTVAPFYVFGDKFAIINFDVENSPNIIMVHSPAFARSYRNQFEIMWKNASTKPPE